MHMKKKIGVQTVYFACACLCQFKQYNNVDICESLSLDCLWTPKQWMARKKMYLQRPFNLSMNTLGSASII